MSDDAPEAPDAEEGPDGTEAAESAADAAADGAEDGDFEFGVDGEDGDALAARVAEYDDDLAAEVRAAEERLHEQASELESRAEEIEDLEARLKRVQADFQNYKKRTQRKQEQIRERATEDLVERLASVRNNLVRALQQDENADIRDGVEATLKEFDRVFEDEGVSVIEPEPGEAVDPTRHEVMMRVDADQPAGTVVDVYQPGYAMAGTVLTAAQVTVSEGAGSADGGADDGDGDGEE